MCQRCRQGQFHPHAPGQCPDALFICQAELVEVRLKQRPVPSGIHTAEHSAHIPWVQPFVEKTVLQHHTNVCFGLFRLLSQQTHGTAVRPGHAQHGFYQRSLSRTVFTDQAQNGTAGQRQIDRTQREIRIALRQ